MLYVLATVALGMMLGACMTGRPSAGADSSQKLSADEVLQLLKGNTLYSVAGDSFFFDSNGMVRGLRANGADGRAGWEVAQQGQLCLSSLDVRYRYRVCYSIVADRKTLQRELFDNDGYRQYVVDTVVPGNPNNF